MSTDRRSSIAIPACNEERHLGAHARVGRGADLPRHRRGARRRRPLDRPHASRSRSDIAGVAVSSTTRRRIQAAGLNLRARRSAAARSCRAGRRPLRARTRLRRALRRRARRDRRGDGRRRDGAGRAEGDRQRGIAAAMRSRLGAGPARFHAGGDGGLGRHGVPRRVPLADARRSAATPRTSASTRTPSSPSAWRRTAASGSTRRSVRRTRPVTASAPSFASSTGTGAPAR